MDENRQKAYEDIACIRDILARTAADFKELASFFIAMGLILGVKAFLGIGLDIWNITSTMRYISGVEIDMLRQAGIINVIDQYSQWLLFVALIVVYILCRRKILEGLSGKLMNIWGLCLFLFVGASLVVRTMTSLQMLMLYRGILSEETVNLRVIGYGAMYVERCLKLVFPVLPILITSVFLQNRRLKAVGVVAGVLVLLWIFVPGTAVSVEGSVPTGLLWEMLWKRGLVIVIQIIPAAALLAFGHNLKKT